MRILLCSVFLLTLLSIQVLAQEKGAKAIFHSGEGPTVMASSYSEGKKKPANEGSNQNKPMTENYMGISYWIDLIDNTGQRLRVSPQRTFKSGERIKLNIESNRDGYLYVINVGSSGNSHILYPNPGVRSNFVEAGLPFEVPFNTFMRFDENPGEETLLVMLSPNPIGGIPFETPVNRPLNNQETQQYMQVAQAKGAKDIVLETDSTGPTPAGYAVAPMSSLISKMITLNLKLTHR